MQATFRDKKKLADKERKQIEEAARAKVAALQDDDNVFDVAYEQQGGGGEASDVLSATDIKVTPLERLSGRRRVCCMELLSARLQKWQRNSDAQRS